MDAWEVADIMFGKTVATVVTRGDLYRRGSAGEWGTPAELLADLWEDEKRHGAFSEWACELLGAESPKSPEVREVVRELFAGFREWCEVCLTA